MTVSLLLALGAAVCFGVCDYVSGMFSRRLSMLDILGFGSAIGLILIVLLLPFFPEADATTADLGWGFVSGLAAAGAALLLLRGFRVGRFGVVSPVSSVGAAGIPVVVGLALGEDPSAIVLTGLVAGIAAIWLVSGSASPAANGARPRAAGLWEGLGAGILLAVMFLTLSRADFASGPWPVLTLQLGLLAVIGVALVLRRKRPRITLDDIPGVSIVGATAVIGTLGFIYSAYLGLVSIAAVVTAMSPAVTVLMARMLIAEHFTPRQLVGLAAAAVAIILISLG